MTIEDRLGTLDSLWALWAAYGRELDDERWRRPTRLAGSTVRSLYAHAASWPYGLSVLVERVRDAEPSHATAAGLLRDFNAPGGVAGTMRETFAELARQHAARYADDQLIGQFAETGPRAIAAARGLGPVVVDYHGQALLRLDEAVSIGVVEATVHLLDLLRALDRAPDVPADGLTHTAAVLAAIPSPVDFVEAATGRGTRDLFPLMS